MPDLLIEPSSPNRYTPNVPDPVAMADWYVEHCDMKIVLQIDEPPFTRFLADQQGKTCIEVYNAQTTMAEADHAPNVKPLVIRPPMGEPVRHDPYILLLHS